MRCVPVGHLVRTLVAAALFGVLVSSVFPHPSNAARPSGAPETGSRETRESGPLAVSDSLYTAHHPRLLFTPGEIPALVAKVHDGGADDAAYSFIRILLQYIYPGSTPDQLLGDGSYGLSVIPNYGLGSVLQTPTDLTARDRGRSLTLYIADHWAPDDDNFGTALRLRALALGYDMFFEASNEAERTRVRDEIRAYMDMMLNDPEYGIWSYRPYLANISAMIASSLGLAAICLDGESDPAVVDAALDKADDIISAWLYYQLDENGAYNEGALYGSWSMRNLVYYFWARVRYDGFDYAANSRIRNMEKWFAYELHPDGGGAVNNIQDCSYLESPLAQNTTYFDWAKTAWGSRLSAYIWEHVAGTYGYNAGDEADKAGTVIWHRNLVPQQPGSVLPKSMVWEHRGLYYFRTGWPAAAKSKDILFSFYSGEFQGGHAQEDQNQFTLYAYGAPFAIDHGLGTIPVQSEAHNMILIDGDGQHNAGRSIGTDGDLRRYLMNGFSDYLMGDATEAYTTHSPLNNPGFPFPSSDWSWGYTGANPVDHAYRSVFVVRDPETPPYFIVIDDIDKDGTPHTYEWRLHTGRNNTIDTAVNPIAIAYGGAFLDVHVVSPPFPSLQKTVTNFNNLVPDPDSKLLSLATTAANPLFAFVLVPRDGSFAAPTVTSTPESWGVSVAIQWASGKTDVVLVNRSGALVTHSLGLGAAQSAGRPAAGPQTLDPRDTAQRQTLGPRAEAVATAGSGTLETDADLALIRLDGTAVERYLLAGASTFSANGIDYVTIHNGTATIGFSGAVIDIDRYDADFALYAPGVTDMFYRGQRITVVETDGVLTRDPVASISNDTPRLLGINVRTYPNPFNPASTIVVELDEPGSVAATIFDAKGRLVRRLWNGSLPAGPSTLRWNGENEAGHPAASGVYFLAVTGSHRTTTLKITLVR
jgi:hypothetical protein